MGHATAIVANPHILGTIITRIRLDKLQDGNNTEVRLEHPEEA